jgi:AAA-like domain/GUN4-like
MTNFCGYGIEGGALSGNALIYVFRSADEMIYQFVTQGRFCSVLTARQMGKSSLINRTIQRLQAEQKFACSVVSLMNISRDGVTSKQWYLSLARKISRDCLQHFDADKWDADQSLTPASRFGRFLEMLLQEVPDHLQIVIFIDELNSIFSLDFPADDFFAIVREHYDTRSRESERNRLTFAFLGVASPYDLIRDKLNTTFNVGSQIELTGFRYEEAHPLLIGLQSEQCQTDHPEALLKAILEQTGGQPFLTQKLCQLVLESDRDFSLNCLETSLAQLVQTEIIQNWERQDNPQHLRTIRDRILRNEQYRDPMLELYQEILQRSSIQADGSVVQIELQLSGLVKKLEGQLRVYNPIYAAIFNQDWIDRHLSSSFSVDYSHLVSLLQVQDWEAADQETKLLLLRLSGQLQQQSFSLRILDRIPNRELRTLDRLWMQYSHEDYGFSAQYQIWQEVQGNHRAYWRQVNPLNIPPFRRGYFPYVILPEPSIFRLVLWYTLGWITLQFLGVIVVDLVLSLRSTAHLREAIFAKLQRHEIPSLYDRIGRIVRLKFRRLLRPITWKRILVWFGIAVLVVVPIVTAFFDRPPQPGITHWNYSEFVTQVERGAVEAVLVSPDQTRAAVRLKNSRQRIQVDLPRDPNLYSRLAQHQIEVELPQRESLFAWLPPVVAVLQLVAIAILLVWWCL